MSQYAYLRRRAAAAYLRENRGFPCSEKTLAKLACIGGEPVYRLFGRIPLYTSLTRRLRRLQARQAGPLDLRIRGRTMSKDKSHRDKPIQFFTIADGRSVLPIQVDS